MSTVNQHVSALNHSTNPYPSTSVDRHEIWEILVAHDFEGFVAGDWSLVARDFWHEGFMGIHAHLQADPRQWELTFPSVESYRDEWLRQVKEFAFVQLQGVTLLEFLFQSCRLEKFAIEGGRAAVLKQFSGSAKTVDGDDIRLCFQSLYKLIQVDKHWKIAGFVGYLPYHAELRDGQSTASTPW